jgi:hypothetical protein
VPGNNHTDMVRASSFAGSGDFLLRLTSWQGKDPIAEAWFARGWFCGRSAPGRTRRRVEASIGALGVLAVAALLAGAALL